MPESLNVSIYEDIEKLGLKAPDIAVPHTPSYGQCAEDIIVCASLRALAFKEQLDLSKEFYLEIGANHPIATSATWLLHKSLGMHGVLVEANPHLLDDLKRVRPHDNVLHAAVIATDASTTPIFISSKDELSSTNKKFLAEWPGEPIVLEEDIVVPALRINDVIIKHMDGKSPLFLSIDVEGEDLTILNDLDLTRFRPAIIQIEPSDHFLENNSRDICDLMQRNTYDLIARTNVNLIFTDSARSPVSREIVADLHATKEALGAAEQENQRLLKRFSELNKHALSSS